MVSSLEFKQVNEVPEKVTKHWYVQTLLGGTVGEVYWWAGKTNPAYIFVPTKNMLFDARTLQEIQSFLVRETDEYKNKP